MNKLKQLMYSGIALAPASLPLQGQGVTLNEIEARIQQAAQFLIVISMVVAVIFIVWGGLRLITARGDKTRATAAKDTILHGIYGAAVILAVGVILQTVAGLVTRSFFG